MKHYLYLSIVNAGSTNGTINQDWKFRLVVCCKDSEIELKKEGIKLIQKEYIHIWFNLTSMTRKLYRYSNIAHQFQENHKCFFNWEKMYFQSLGSIRLKKTYWFLSASTFFFTSGFQQLLCLLVWNDSKGAKRKCIDQELEQLRVLFNHYNEANILIFW